MVLESEGRFDSCLAGSSMYFLGQDSFTQRLIVLNKVSYCVFRDGNQDF